MLKSHTTTQLIAKEGWLCVSFFFILFVVSYCIGFLSWLFFLLLLLSAFIYRNFERIPAEDDKMSVLAPVDGKITNISKVVVKDKTEFLKVEIRKNILDASILRSPASVAFIKTKIIHGLFLEIENKLSKKLNERAILSFKSHFGVIVMIINGGLFARKIELFKKIGRLKFAERLGILVDGKVELLLPLSVRIKVNLGDKVKAGESVLGYFSSKVEDYE
ncbi:MAG: phosphatidylserine decarboxylase [Sulfurospirillaceae bacterium]|nr:phosphatidylserine decarboxylase [Sulfurospirillaceae bacterium]